jgi:KipI family sensor histidine kinase inhibitor
MRFLDAGDCALSVQCEDGETAARMALALRQSPLSSQLIEVVPGLESVLVVFDPDRLSRQQLEADLAQLAAQPADEAEQPGKLWRIPVLYDGPDLAPAAQALGLSIDELIHRHAGATYRVRLLGFLPGFAYMDGLDPGLRLPRLAQPRVKVPAGSLAMAEGMTAIYPWDSPGGWHLLGRTDQRLFDQDRDPPALLAPGDRVEFTPS